MLHLRPVDYRTMPWKNGRGVTIELARVDGADGSFDWRVSIADVPEDGPFSRFGGYDRVITLVAGAGMTLRHTEPERPEAPPSIFRLGPLDVHGFSGDWDTWCTLLDGPVRDFNLMVRRGVAVGGIEVHALRRKDELGLASSTRLVYALTGFCTVAAGRSAVRLAPGECALLDEDDAPIWLRAVENPATAIVAGIERSEFGDGTS